MKARSKTAWAVAAAGAVGLAGATVTSCQQQPINSPLRSLERSQRVDFVCMHVAEPNPTNPVLFTPVPPQPLTPENCAPVPQGTAPAVGAALPNHLFALITQSARGEIGIVDITASATVDTDIASPGVNFIPVGGLPTDVAVTPDGQMAFVGAAEPNKTAIYGLPSRLLLGNSEVSNGLDPTLAAPAPSLTMWPACALPQAPGAVTVVPRMGSTAAGGVSGDGGTAADGGAGADGGAPSGTAPYFLVVALPGGAGDTSKVITIDPTPFLRGAGLDTSAGPSLTPGGLPACPIIAALELTASVPSQAPIGPPWDDGVPYADGGAPDAAPTPAPGTCAPTGPDGGMQPFAIGPQTQPRAGATVRSGQTLYVADDALPIIHVFDLADPSRPRELSPLLATSIDEPERPVTLSALAVSPPTRNYKRYLYAVERRAGALIVFDVTDPQTSPRVPLTRPHPELNPFQPRDRISFGSPVVAVEFFVNDWPLTQDANGAKIAARSGDLCNPNPNAGTGLTGPFLDPGANYRANVPSYVGIPLGPGRLRGVFAFATLTTGQVVTIDVDDWDGPCRRPDPMDGAHATSAVGQPEPPATSGSDRDPYHVPLAFQNLPNDDTTPVSLEAYFPVSAPNRIRSLYLLQASTTTGVRVPYLSSEPQLLYGSANLSTSTTTNGLNPILLATRTDFVDPAIIANPIEPNPANRTYTIALGPGEKPDRIENAAVLVDPRTAVAPSLRFAYEDPLVQFNHDWSVTYEGVLPTLANLPGDLTTSDGYQTLSVSNTSALFCRSGVQDLAQGSLRAQAAVNEMQTLGLPVAAANVVRPLPERTSDYVQLIDDILSPIDPYWALDEGDAGEACWDPGGPQTPDAKYRACFDTFGSPSDQNVLRDFPILEAYQDHLVVGRFGYPNMVDGSGKPIVDAAGKPVAGPISTTNRVAVGKNPDNAAFLKLVRCCFHHQANFRVRAGAEWLAVSSAVGYLHHVTADPATSRCVETCDASKQLLNARAFDVPRPTDTAAHTFPGRDSALALRNPMFSFVVWTGAPAQPPEYTTTLRDTQWRFSVRGQFIPLTINIAQNSANVSPQSMKFIPSLGQVAVVDGAGQGLSLISLQTATLARPPFL